MIDNESDNLIVSEAGTTASRIVNVVVAITVAAGDEDVVTTIVHIGDDTVALIDRPADSVISGVLETVEVSEAEVIRLGPVDEAAACIATVVTEVGVESARVATIATIGHEHRDGGDGATSSANGVRASTQLIIAPGGTALSPVRGIDTTNSVVGS